jgi:hypothetical protein
MKSAATRVSRREEIQIILRGFFAAGNHRQPPIALEPRGLPERTRDVVFADNADHFASWATNRDCAYVS